MNAKNTVNSVRVSSSNSFFITIILCALMQPAMANVFVNEIHYDNTGADTGEAIEIAGTAGTDLTGWSLVLYNGSNSLLYNTVMLSGTIADQQDGFGTSSYAIAGIQNGSPDGIALVDAASNVVQFLSYEGSFTAASGPANGMTSTDIGVSESSSAAVGSSLQLTGAGEVYADFAWAGSQPSTFDAVNSGQTFGAGPGVVINEVDADQSGTDAAEFIELFDGGAGNTDLGGLSLVLFNGSDDASYLAFDLDGFSTNGDGYFVLCGNAANVANCDLDVSPDTNLIQNGADAVALLTGDAVDFPNDTPVTTTNLIDAIVYDTDDSDDAGLLVLLNAGQPQVNERDGGSGTTHSNQRCANGSGGGRNTNTYLQFNPTPGAENVCVAPPRMAKIHEVQGSGSASPEVGNIVIVEGIVVGDFQGGASGASGDLDGFFVQEEDADIDADPMTSEGIFVFDGSSPSVDVAVGDLVSVEGPVSEFNGLTEITSFSGVTVLGNGNPLPTAAAASLPVTATDDFEALEGMLVTFEQPLVISAYFNFDRFNEILLTSERHLNPTAEFEPGPDAIQAAQDFALDGITLDDGRTTQNPDPAIHPNGLDFDLSNLFRGGDTLRDVTGVMHYAFGQYRIQPTQGANYANDNLRTAQPDAVGGTLKVASFNVLNYFSTLDQAPNRGTCGPAEDQGCRGADNETEFTRQRDKIIAALTEIDADVVGLIEIENHPTDEAVKDLIDGLNAVNGAGAYDYVPTGTIGADVIKVALIYKPASASLFGDYAILDSSVDARFSDTLNRPVLAQAFMDRSTGGILTVAVNHLKSKGSNCDAQGDPDTGDGSGNCNLTRTSAAEALVDWLATDPTGSGNDNFLIVGDLNSYDKEDPIDSILAGGYTDLIHAFRGEDAYTFTFSGQTGYLDYALASEGLMDAVTGLATWHINADESDLINYDTSFKRDNQDAIYAPDAYRSSDHDPVVVGLKVCDQIAPSFDSVTVTPSVLWPANHKYVDIDAAVTVGDNGEAIPTVTLVSLTSNEPDNGKGDGNTVNDIVVVDDFRFRLRAERSGRGSGRVYSITYLATDICGNTATATATVSVPHSRRK